MDLLQLYYFVTIAECENITKAANQLHVAQPSLSKSLSRIEKELGTQLFDRQGRRIVLNHYGRIALARVQNIFRELDNLHAEINTALMQETATITIGSVDAIYVTKWLPTFIQNHPNIMVRHTVASCAMLERQLENGSIDFAITDAHQLPDNISSFVLGSDEYIVLAPKSSSIPDNSRQDFSIFCGEPFICSPKTEDILRPIDILSQTTGCKPNIVFEGGADLNAQVLEMNYGNLITPLSQIAEPEKWTSCQEQLKIILLKNHIARFNVHLIWDARRIVSPAGEALLDFVQNHTHQFQLKQ